ncbi:MAG: lipocalin family protein [Porticoccaceae bacterium]|jgi:apolipoprotein D and lipocalin family protein
MRLLAVAVLSLSLWGCLGSPEGVEPVDNFRLESYLGRWYEIARLDHSFERGLHEVTADYSVRDDGGIRVINSGRSAETGELSEAEGRAYFVGSEDTGHLKVSFFGPFFGSYIVFDLDKDNYQYAFVAGNSRDYLWLLARTPQVSDLVMEQFLARATTLGFDTQDLIYVRQESTAPEG